MRLCAASWMPAARLRHLLRNFLPALMGGGEVFFNFGKQIAFQSKLSLKGEDVPNARAIRGEASLGISQPVAMVIALRLEPGKRMFEPCDSADWCDRQGARGAGKLEMIAVEGTPGDIVEGIVIEPGQAVGAIGIGPDPRLESRLDLGELLLSGFRSTVFSTRRSVSPSRIVSKICGTDEFRASERS